MLLPYYKQGVIEAGCDEAGRGCLAGSVYAAAVILPTDYHNDLLNDSKQLTAKQRRATLDNLLEYYHVHLTEFHNFTSHEVLHAVLSKA